MRRPTAAAPRLNRVLLCSLLLLGILTAVCADDFTVDWHRIGSGGGTSSSDEFTVTGVIETAPSGDSTAGDLEFTVTGGFGVVVALPSEGAPALSISATSNGTVRIHWPVSAADWELRQSSDLTSDAWEPPSEPVQQDGLERFILIERPFGIRLFRLSRTAAL